MLFMTRRPKACRRALQLDFYNMDFESKICKEEKNLKGQMLGTKSFCVLSTLTANLQYHECTQCRTTRVSLKEQFYLLDLTPQQSRYFERISYEVNPTLLSAPHALHIFICSSGEQR